METLSQRGINLAAPRLCLPGESRVKILTISGWPRFRSFSPLKSSVTENTLFLYIERVLPWPLLPRSTKYLNITQKKTNYFYTVQ